MGEEVGEVEATNAVGQGDHVDYAGAFSHDWEEETREQVGPDIVDADRTLQPVGGGVVARVENAGVVHEQVEAAEADFHLVREVAHGLEVGQVNADDFDVAVARLVDDFLSSQLGSLRIWASHDEVIALRGYGFCLFKPHACGCAGDYGEFHGAVCLLV